MQQRALNFMSGRTFERINEVLPGKAESIVDALISLSNYLGDLNTPTLAYLQDEESFSPLFEIVIEECTEDEWEEIESEFYDISEKYDLDNGLFNLVSLSLL